MRTGSKFTGGMGAGMLVSGAARLPLAPEQGKETIESVAQQSHMMKEGIEKLQRCKRGDEASNHHVELID